MAFIQRIRWTKCTEADLFSAKDLTEFAENSLNCRYATSPASVGTTPSLWDVTGLVIERISGMPFDEYLTRNIFEPLGMEDTFFEVPESKLGSFSSQPLLEPRRRKTIHYFCRPTCWHRSLHKWRHTLFRWRRLSVDCARLHALCRDASQRR